MPTGDNGADFNGFDFTSFVGSTRRDRPWLLPSNRKLRHLQGLSLRNLTLSSTGLRARGKTIDDESLPQSWKSPAKRLAQEEIRRLGHSRSSSDLAASTSWAAPPVPAVVEPTPDTKLTPQSARSGRSRRKSTLSWSGQSPLQRREKYEDVASARIADTWFSLHCDGEDDPVYISEVVPKAMNPSFRFFNMRDADPQVSRDDKLRVLFWTKSSSSTRDYKLLLEVQLHLRSLQFIGKSLENFHHPLPPNCIIFHLMDGIYANLTDLPTNDPPPFLAIRPSTAKEKGSDVQSTSSYDALMRLSSLDDCIQDALATRATVTAQINELLANQADALNARPRALAAQESLASTKRYLTAERKQLKAAVKARADLKASLAARREAMWQGSRSQAQVKQYLEDARAKIGECYTMVKKSKDEIHAQQRRIVDELLRVYPIEPIPNETLQFTIASLPLPNSTSHSEMSSSPLDATIAAALGYVTQVLSLLSLYLAVPLPYPVQPYGSISTVHDLISLLPTGQAPTLAPPGSASSADNVSPTRIFPLFTRGVPSYRFEYGLFLINKDIERLMAARGLKVLDLRQTLPNLKYLVEVIRGGDEAFPERKRSTIPALRRVIENGEPPGAGAGNKARHRVEQDVSSVAARLKGRAEHAIS